jgi:hypothetical protein
MIGLMSTCRRLAKTSPRKPRFGGAFALRKLKRSSSEPNVDRLAPTQRQTVGFDPVPEDDEPVRFCDDAQ